MYIIIVGGGRLGHNLAKSLISQSYEVLVIEKDPELVERINAELGSVALVGDGCEGKMLESAGARRADIFISLTGEDEDNLVACQIARHHFNIPRTIARLLDERNEQLFKKLGIDVTINSTNIILEHIKHELPSPPVMHLLKGLEKDYEVVDITVPSSAQTVGRSVAELPLPEGVILALIIRRDRTPLVPGAETLIEAEDQIIAVTSLDNEPSLRTALTGK